MKDILKNELNVFDDKETYYFKNPSGNILQVTKEIVMYRFGFIWKPAPGATTEERVGTWKKALPAEEGFELVDEKDWQEMETERLEGINPVPVEKKDKERETEDEGVIIKKAEAEAKAKADAEEGGKKNELL